jgi:membrane protease YdiL (CAAX protease family)
MTTIPTPTNEALARHERVTVPVFVAVLFLVSWIGATPMVLASWGRIEPNNLYKALQIVLMLLGAGLVAIWASAVNGGRAGVKHLLRGLLRWRAGWGWWLAVLLGPAAIAAAAIAIAAALQGTKPVFYSPADTLGVFASAFIPYFFLNTEELAWRGYLLPRLQTQFGAVVASAVIGVLWAVFHIPIFLVKGGHPAGYALIPYLVMVFAFSFIFTTVFNRTSGSILLVHVLHQSMNAWTEAVPFFPRAAHSVVPHYVMIALCAVIAVAFVFSGKISPGPTTSEGA